jgi:RNA polymerase sigma-70 factor (ECF subfamily)
MSGAPSTRATLLVRLRERPDDQAAWNEFVERYGPLIYAWCRHFRMQEADAQDVAQMVMIKLARTLPGFEYDPSRSFRGWLRTLTQNAWSDFLKEQRVRAGGGPAGEDILQSLEARDDLVRRLEEAFDQDILAQARDQVKARVEMRTWQAFELTAVDGVPAAEVSGRLGLRVGAVYQARSHVQKLLREAVAQLSGEE